MKESYNNRRDIFIPSERSLNYTLRPVQVRQRAYPYTYQIENYDRMVNVTVSRPWTFMNHLVLDFIGAQVFEQEYKKVRGNKNTWKNDLSKNLLMTVEALKEHRNLIFSEELEANRPTYREFLWLQDEKNKLDADFSAVDRDERRRKLGVINQQLADISQNLGPEMMTKFDKLNRIFKNGRGGYAININPDKIAERYRSFFGGNRRREYLLQLLEATASVKFTMDYPIQVPVLKTYVKDGNPVSAIIDRGNEFVPIENESLFNVEYREDGAYAFFATFLGKLYCHNLLTLNTDWLPERFLNLDGFASAVFRRFILPRKKLFEQPVKEMIEFFGWEKDSRYPARLIKAFEKMKDIGLIKDFTVENGRGKFSKGYLLIEK